MGFEEVIVRLVLACILGILTWAAGSTYAAHGATSAAVTALCCTIIFAGIAFGGLVRFVSKPYAIATLIFAGIAGIVTIVLQLHLLPICGDAVCSLGECKSCPGDCTADKCSNGICEPPVERCDNSHDCRCAAGSACMPGRNASDKRGCGLVECDDGYCDTGENTVNCCADCGCKSGFACKEGKCFFEPPDISFSIRALTNNISVTSLAANPLLADDVGEARPLIGLLVRSDRYTKNMTATFAIDGILRDTVDIGSLGPGNEMPVLWYPTPRPSLLTVDKDTLTQVDITLKYDDAQDDEHTIVRHFPITLRARGTLDGFGHITMFATPIKTRSTTPSGIWDELRAQVKLDTGSPDRVRFPLETLRDGHGSLRDVALLLAGAYRDAGFDPALIEGPAGIGAGPLRLFVGIETPGKRLMIDPMRWNRTFDSALIEVPGIAYYGLATYAVTHNQTSILFNESVLRASLNLTTVTVSSCVCAPCRTTTDASHLVRNDGIVAADACVVSLIVAPGDADETRECVRVAPGETKEINHRFVTVDCVNVSVQARIE